MSAAKIVRGVVANAHMGETAMGNDALIVFAADLPEGDVDEALHTAADALEALAVVADLLALCARADMVTAWDANGDDIEMRLNDQHRAALATLAKIGSDR